MDADQGEGPGPGAGEVSATAAAPLEELAGEVPRRPSFSERPSDGPRAPTGPGRGCPRTPILDPASDGRRTGSCGSGPSRGRRRTTGRPGSEEPGPRGTEPCSVADLLEQARRRSARGRCRRWCSPCRNWGREDGVLEDAGVVGEAPQMVEVQPRQLGAGRCSWCARRTVRGWRERFCAGSARSSPCSSGRPRARSSPGRSR